MQSASPKVLCMFSGGLDSAAAVHAILTDPAYRDHTILVHHITMTNVQQRHQAELEAVESLLDYFVTELGFRMDNFTHNVIDFRFFTRGLVWDMDITRFVAGMICSQDRAIRKVVFGRTKSDLEMARANFHGRARRANEILELALGPGVAPEDRPEVIYPLVELTKRQVWERLPPDFRELTWSCRSPRYAQGTPTACGRCGTCREMAQAGIPVQFPLRVVGSHPDQTPPAAEGSAAPGSPT